MKMMTTIQAKAVTRTLMGAFPELDIETHTPDGQAGDDRPAVIIRSRVSKQTVRAHDAFEAGDFARMLSR